MAKRARLTREEVLDHVLGSSGINGPSLIMHALEWAWPGSHVQLLAGNFNANNISGYCEIVTMSLLELGAIIFGGNDKIIAYFWSKGLLASSKTCARYNTLYKA